MNEQDHIRVLYLSDEFLEYYEAQTPQVQRKFNYVMDILKSEHIISSKFVKKLVNTSLYELRISAGTNEHRSIMFAIDNIDIIQAKRIILLNAFLKKSTKEYAKQITIAERILGGLTNDRD